MKSDFFIAVTQLAAERGLPRDTVLGVVEAALVSAYRKEGVGAGHDLSVRLDPGDGEVSVYILKRVVKTAAEIEDDRREITLREARKLKPDAAVDDVIEIIADFAKAGRIAAQTAKQAVLQRLREAERELVLAEYTSRVGEIIAGRIERVEPHQVVVNLGRADALMPRDEEVPSERYRPNTTLQFYLSEVAESSRGPELILSRAHRNLVRRLFEREVPEVYKGVVEIKAIAREPGSRTKVAVVARQEGVDPVGSCVGLRGFRIQNIVNELQGEKIDVLPYSDDMRDFLANALSPAQVIKVDLEHEEKSALIIVPDRHLSLAIGREGQNARLAAKLTGWRIDIRSESEFALAAEAEAEAAAEAAAAEAEAILEDNRAAAVAIVEAEVAVAGTAVEAVEQEVIEAEAEPEVEAPVAEAVEEPVAEAEAVVEAAPEPEPVVLINEDAELEELLRLEAEEAAEEEMEERQPEPAGISVDDDSIWVLPETIRSPSVLRFAEDIMPAERGRARAERDRRPDPNAAPAGPDNRPRAKKGKRSR
ncbi:MAG: transcription termination factor NusA [Chloroflexi bacterium]|nr:transcription termination factor NusA [Chloroflexota bacterium]